MTLSLIAAVSDPGKADRANEDASGTAGRFAWVIDGATGLGDTPLIPAAPSDAAWLTGVLNEAMAEAAGTADGPQALLAHAVGVAARRFPDERVRAPAERYEIPTAAVLVAAFSDEAVSIAELGDCAIYLRNSSGLARFGGTERGRALEQENARRLMGGGGGRTPQVLAALREVRNKANTPGGYPIVAPDAQSTARARLHHHPFAGGDALLLTDGFEAAVDDYSLFERSELVDAVAHDVHAARDALRQVERDDPDCRRFPRFKASDDATALLVRYTPAP